MLKLQKSTLPVSSLVGDRPEEMFGDISIFATVSPNPATKHKCLKNVDGKHVTIQMRYDMLPQRVQVEYCIRLIESTYMQFIGELSHIVGCFELNKQGNIHCHLLITDYSNTNETHLTVYRRDILNCLVVIKNLSHAKGGKDYMNNIVRVNKPIKEIVEYMDKDFELNKGTFPTIFF